MLMTQKRTLFAAMGALCILTAGRVGADATSEAQKAIQSAYKKRNAAAAKKDVAGMMADCTPDFSSIDQQGKKHTSEEMKARASQMFQFIKSIKANSVVEKVTLKGKEAQALTKEQVEAKVANPQTGKESVLSIVTKSQDTWVKGAKGWLLKQTKSLSSTQKIDGVAIELPKK